MGFEPENLSVNEQKLLHCHYYCYEGDYMGKKKNIEYKEYKYVVTVNSQLSSSKYIFSSFIIVLHTCQTNAIALEI